MYLYCFNANSLGCEIEIELSTSQISQKNIKKVLLVKYLQVYSNFMALFTKCESHIFEEFLLIGVHQEAHYSG